MKCSVPDCYNEAAVHVTENDGSKEYDVCKDCFEREESIDILGETHRYKIYQVGTKHRPLEIVAQ